MVGQTRGPTRPPTAAAPAPAAAPPPPRSFQVVSSSSSSPPPPPSSDTARIAATTTVQSPESESSTPDVAHTVSASDASIAEDGDVDAVATDDATLKIQNQKVAADVKQTTNVKVINSDVTRYVKKMTHLTNSQILSILPGGKAVEGGKQQSGGAGAGDKPDPCTGGNAKVQPNFLTMQQKISEKLLANQIPIQRLPEQQIILKQVNASDNIVAMTAESNQNYFTMLTNKPQTNYVNYVSLPVNQQNFITVDQQQKGNFVVMEAQQPAKGNIVTVPQKSTGQTYLVHGNSADLKQFNSYLAVTTKPGDTNGTTFFTMTPTKHNSGPQTTYLMTPKQTENSRTFVAVAQKTNEGATYVALPAGKSSENNKTATFIAMEPNKTDTNIIVTQVLPSSQHFQLEYADGDASKTGKYFNSRDGAVAQSVVPKLSCTAVTSTSGVLSTKTAITNTLPPLTSATATAAGAPPTPASKKNNATSKVLTTSSALVPAKTTIGNIYITTSANVTFISPSNVQTVAESNPGTFVTNSTGDVVSATESKEKRDGKSVDEEATPTTTSTTTTTVTGSTLSSNVSNSSSNVLSSNVPHSHQYLIPNMDNLKLAAETMTKIIPPSSNPPPPPHQTMTTATKASIKHASDQMHNYSKNDSSSSLSSSSSSSECNPRKKLNQIENNKLKNNSSKVSQFARSDAKSRVVEARPTNHQRMKDAKNALLVDDAKDPIVIKSEVEDRKVKVLNEEEEEGVEVRPVFDMRIPLVFQVVLTDHSYGLPMLVVRDEKPQPVEDDKESVISSDAKGEDGEETETAAEGEDSITRCICDMEHDDGYMVCCDKCSVWQHVACVFPDVRVGTALPEEYLCDACHPRKLDRNRARALQLQRRKQIFNNSESSDSSSSSLEISSRVGTGTKKQGAVARRRAEPIQRKTPKLGKLDHGETPIKNATAVKARRRDPALKSQVGRRTKLRKKMEVKLPRGTMRRKSKNREAAKSERDSSTGTQKDRSDKDGLDEPNRKSPDLRARLQIMKNSGLRVLNVKHSRVRCRIGHLPQGEAILLASCNLTKGQLIVEIRGKFLFSDEQPGKADCLFFYRFPKEGSEIVVDATGEENMVRTARRSCRPNTQMKHCIVKGSLRLYLIATEDLNKNQEITIAHNSISDNVNPKEGCACRSKDCPFTVQKHPQNVSYSERRRRGRRRTISDESEGSPVKNKKENVNKAQAEPPSRKNSSLVQSNRSPCSPVQPPETRVEKDRKLTRDERKIEQAMKIFAQMERDTARKKDKDRPQLPLITPRKDHNMSSKADSDKESVMDSNKSRRRRRRRRRRSRKVRLPSGGSAISVTQFNSGDSDMSSADELPSPRRKTVLKDSRESDLQSPTDKIMSPRRRELSNRERDRDREQRHDAAGLLLSLGGRFLPGQKTPTRDKESENEGGSPPTPLSSACLLVAAAVGPLAPGFRFPKTKKGLMNEWLNKSPEHSNQEFSPTAEIAPPNPQSESSLPPGAPKLSNLSNRLFSFPIGDDKSLELKVDPVKDPRMMFDTRTNSGTPAGFGKKRWLRQAISEECDAPQGQGSPPCPPDNVTPLKKRRLARESLSSDPPTTPPMPHTTSLSKDEPMYGGDINSPESPAVLDTESEISLAERVDALRREYLEAQERNLLKEYDREKQLHTNKESEATTCATTTMTETSTTTTAVEGGKTEVTTTMTSYDRFNNYNFNDQRSPENLTFRYPDAPTYFQGSTPAATNEKPLDLTGEKTDGDVSTAESEGEKVESSLKSSRKLRGKRGAGRKEEVRTSPRFRKGTTRGRRTVDADDNGDDCDEKGSTKAELSLSSSSPLDDEKPANDVESVSEQAIGEEKCIVAVTSDIPSRKDEIDDEKVLRNGYAVKSEDDGGLSVKSEVSNGNGKDTPPIVNNSDGVMAVVKSEGVVDNARESRRETKVEVMENDSFSADKTVPIKRKLSITEYLRRKKYSTSAAKKSNQHSAEDDGIAGASPQGATSPLASPSSDEDKSCVSLPTPILPPVFLEMDKSLEKPGSGVRFKSEPTELERQRENLTERLRREFGLLISDDEPKPMMKAEPPSDDVISPPPPPPPPPPPLPPPTSASSYPSYNQDSGSDYMDTLGKRSLYHPPSQPIPQSAIYPVGSSNPPNPSCVFSSPYPSLTPPPPPPPPLLPPSMKHAEEKRKDKKIKKFKQ